MRHFILLLNATAACAQIVSMGVKAGVPVTPALRFGGFGVTDLLDTGRWTIGPTIEFRLVHGFSVEADATYRGYRKQESYAFPEHTFNGVTQPGIFYSEHSNNKVWDFPVLLKYRYGSRAYRPFVAAGYTWSHRTTDERSLSICLGSAELCSASPLTRPVVDRTNSSGNSSGPTLGGGVEFKRGKFKFAPEMRYTHLSNPTASLATVMLGVTF